MIIISSIWRKIGRRHLLQEVEETERSKGGGGGGPNGHRRLTGDHVPRRSEGELHRLGEPEREKGGGGVPGDQQLTLEA